MAKKVNKSVVGLLTLFVFAAVTIGGISLVGVVQKTDPKHWTDLGDQAAGHRDWKQAKFYYYRAYNVSKDPRHLINVGQMLYEHGEELQAYLAWNDGVTQDPHLIEGHSKIIDLFIEFAEMVKIPQNWLKVKDAATALLAADKENPKGLYALGYALMSLSPDDGGNRRAGLDSIRRAAQLAPEVVQYSLSVATYTLMDGNSEEAGRILKRLVDQQTTPGPDAVRVRCMYARYHGSENRTEDAIKMYQEAEQFAGSDRLAIADARSQHAQFWTSRWYKAATQGEKSDDVEGYFVNARDLLEQSITADEEGFLQYMLLSELFSYRGEHEKAIEVCERRLGKPIRREGIKARASKYALYLLYLKGADECLAIAGKLDSKSPDYERMTTRAADFCNSAATEFPELGPGLHTTGKVKLAQGNELEAIRYLQQAKDAYAAPNARNGKLLAQLLLRQNQPGAAKQAIEEALRDPTADPTCDVVAAQVAYANNDSNSAVRFADKALSRMGNDRDALRVKAAALRALGDTELADAINSGLAHGNPQEMYRQAQLLNREGRSDDALALLIRLLDQIPGHIDALGAAVELLLARKDVARAQELIQRAAAAAPDRFEVKMLATRANPDLNDDQRKDAQLKTLKEIPDPFSRSYQLAMWYGEYGMQPEYITALNEAERLLSESSSSIDVTTRKAYLRNIIERQFMYAAGKADTQAIENAVQKAVKESIDGADGQTYRGRAHMLANKPDLALSSFKSALQMNPTDAQTLVYLGQCYMSITPPQVFEAKTSFERAIAANPNLGFAYKGLAAIAQMNGDQPEFEARLDQCAKHIPQDPWVQDLMLAKREKSTPYEGIKRREDIRSREPNNIDNLMALADLYERTKQRDKARECYESLLKIPDVEVRGIAAAAAWFRTINDAPRSLEVLERFVERVEGNEKKAGAVLLIANHWFEVRDAARTEEALKRAAALAETLDVSSAYARFKTEMGDYAPAIEWFNKAIALADQASSTQAPELRRARIDALFRAGRNDEGKKEVIQFVEKYPEDPSGLLLQSAVATIHGDLDAAIQELDRYLEKNSGDLHVIVQRAKLYFAQGRYAVAVRDLETVRSADPKFENYRARIQLADGYALTQKQNLAYDELESIIRDDPAAKDVAIRLVSLYAGRDRHAEAIRVCTSMANRYPAEPVWIKNRADIRLMMDDMPAAIADFELAAKLSNFQPNYTIGLLAAYIKTGRFDDGINYYTQTIPSELRSPHVTLRYAELLARGGRIDDAAPLFISAFSDAGYSNLAFLRDLLQAVTGSMDAERAIDLFRKEPENPRLKRASAHVLAVLLNEFKRDSEALAQMQTLLESAADRNEKIMLLAEMGNVYERQQNWPSAKTSYEELLKLDDRNLLGLNNLAFLLSDKLGQPRDAIPYATRAAQYFPIPNVRDTLGWTHVLLGEYRPAIAILSKAIEEEPQFVPAIYHLSEAYRRDGQLEKAANVLEGAISLLKEGIGQDYNDRIRKAIGDIQRGETAP